MTRISKYQAYNKIVNSNGRIFSVSFTKKDETLREMTCRLGVKKGVKGIGMSYKPSLKNLINVFDIQKDEHRNINLETLKTLKIDGRSYKIGEARKYKRKAAV